MNYKYKIGDKVRIREDLESGIQYDDVTYVSEMDKYRGKVATITNYAGIYHPSYFIDLDEETYYWTAEMFATYFPEDEEATDLDAPVEDEDNFEFAEKIITVQDFIDKFNTTTNTNVALYIRDKDYRVTMGCGDIEDSILYSTFVNAYGRFKVVSISFEYDYDNKVSVALLEVKP